MNAYFSVLLFFQSAPMVEPSTEENIIEIIEEKPDPVTGEFAVDPYTQSNANAGARPFKADGTAEDFGGKAGIRRITDRLVDLSIEDKRISDIFKGHDLVRLRRTLFEQICYILNAGCDYTGRDMRTTHANMGLERDDLNALVEHLQTAMAEQQVPFSVQNRLLSKLAPMEKDVLQK